MLLRGEMAWRARVCAVVLGATLLSIGFAPTVRASDARHFEKVSPVDKGNGDIVGDGGTNVASRAGDAVTLASRTPFGDTVGSGVSGQTQYVARRSADAWMTHAVTPQPRSETYQTFFGATLFLQYSDDLRSAVVWGYDFPSVTGDLPLRNNIYVEDTATRALDPVTALQPGGLPNPLPDPVQELGDPTNWGVSADARHVVFVSRAQYLSQAAPGGVPNVYQWDDGVLSLAGILPDGTVPATGSTVVGTRTPVLDRTLMSADGTRVVFTAPPRGSARQLYMRIDGSRTVQISATEIDPSDPNYEPNPSAVRVRAVTPDGRSVFFTTDSPLVSDDTNGGTDLYRWTDRGAASGDGHLTQISQNGDLDGGQVVGVSDDGERVYYHTSGADLVAWDHGTAHVISSGAVGIPGPVSQQLAVDAWGPGLGRLTPDGKYFAFASDASGSGIGPTGEVTNGHREMYLYRLGGALKCISCPSGPATSDITVRPEVTGGAISFVMPGIRPRFLSDQGKVFFSTAEALVAEDRNGVLDAYEYDPDTDSVRLITTGKGSDPATFVDASASGDDVFFVTRQHLLPSDKDDFVDLYDARTGAALPLPPEEATPPRCEGETCQPPPAASPPDDLLGSYAFDEGSLPDVPKFTVRRRLTLHGAVGSLHVELAAPGTLSWNGRGLRAGSVRRSRSGALALRLRLTRSARARLRASGSYTTSVHLVLTSADGDAAATTRVVFKAAAKKGR